MWRSSSSGVCGAVLAVTLLFTPPLAAAPPAGLLLKSARPLPCAIVMGRIVALDPPGYVARSEAIEDERTGLRETLCIQATPECYVLRYEQIAADAQLSIDFVGRGELRLVSQTAIAKVQLVQPLSAKLRLTVEEGGSRRVVEAATLWHLLLDEPELCNEHLLPLLTLLDGDWQLEDQRLAVERQLLAGAGERRAVSTEEVRQLVDELGAPTFAVRLAAYRQLVDKGPSILPQLSGIKPASLDAEQRARVAEVRSRLSYASPDTPERVVGWLANDADAWSALARRHDQRLKATAEAELLRLRR